MFGTVEIYQNFATDKQQLVHKESNLWVDGASETFCNLLTTPSSINVAPVKGITDASNFTIKAISFGKSSDAYRNNGHFYPHSVSDYTSVGSKYHSYVSSVKSDNRVRAVSLVNENIASTTSSYDPKRDPGLAPNPTDKQLEPDTRTAIDTASGQYHPMGSTLMRGRAHAVGHNLNRLGSQSNPNLLSYTEGPWSDPPLAYWTSANIATTTLSGTHSGPFYGTSAYYVSSTYNTDGSLRQSVDLWKTQFHRNVDHTLSVYIKQPELGNEASSIILNIRDKTGTAVGHSASFLLWDTTTAKHVPPHFSVGTNWVEGTVTPVESETSSTGWYRLEAYLEGLGQSVNTANGDQLEIRININDGSPTGGSVFMWGWQLEESYGATKYQKVSGVRPTFEEGGLDGDIFLGCYPHTSGTDYAILSSLSKIENSTGGTSSIYFSGTYPDSPGDDNFFNSSSVRAMDRDGFVRAYNPSSTTAFTNADEGGKPIYPNRIIDPASGLIVSADADFSAIGGSELSCICTISSGDLGLANMYGGIYKLGLWTLDLDKTLSDTDPKGNKKQIPISSSATKPFSLNFGAGYNKLVYKLFAEKSLTKNLCAIKDATVGDDDVAGADQYSDLTIVWKLNFIGTV